MAKISYLSWEGVYPYLLSALLTGAVSRLDSDTAVAISEAGFDIPSFFSFVQTIELFGTGIIFSIFVFTMAPAAGFIGKIQSTKTFLLFRRYVIEAVIVGVLAAIVAIPLANAKDVTTLATGWVHAALICSLFFLSLFMLLVLRVVRILLFWSRHQLI